MVCSFPHEFRQPLFIIPKESITNKPYPCPKCNKELFLNIKVDDKMKWWQTISEYI